MPAIDHAAFAWDDLDDVEARLRDLGLAPDYGGVHGHGTTEMSMVGFDDGSYLEVIAATDAEGPVQRWPDAIESRAGPCAWCLRVADVGEALKGFIDRGVPVSGPTENGRERPDGTRVEWDRGTYGGEAIDRLVPFLIRDLTPRSFRVQPSSSVSGSPLTGISRVVLAVDDLDARTELFRRLYRYPTPRRTDGRDFGATLAEFPGRPAILAEPSGENWLADRLDRLPAGPCAYLLGTENLDAAAEAFPLTAPTAWLGRRVAWFDADWVGRRLGVIEE